MLTRGVLRLDNKTSGGAEHYSLQISQQLAAMGHVVHLVADCSEDTRRDLTTRGIHVHPVKLPKFLAGGIVKKRFLGWILLHFISNFLAFLKGVSIIKQQSIDLVHAHGAMSSILISYRFPNTPLVCTVHDAGPWLGHYSAFIERIIRKLEFKWIELWAIKRAHFCTVVFKAMKNHLEQKFGVDRTRIKVITPGVNIENFIPVDQKLKTLEFIFVGRLVRRKGTDTLLKIIERLPSLKLSIVGEGPDREWLENSINSLQISKRINFIGHVPNNELPQLLSKALALVSPAHSEGLPLTILEAMSSGIPVVATNVGGIGDVVIDGRTGFLRSDSDIEGILGALESLKENPAKASEMGKNGRALMEEQYTWEYICKQFEQIYYELCLTR
tara:strand:+ start:2377 stop:3534 length:1158 start_codon:yes stop_codon:yes gene_type:complete